MTARVLHLIISGEFAGAERYVASLASLQVAAHQPVAILLPASADLARWRAETDPRVQFYVLPRWLEARVLLPLTGLWGAWVARQFGATLLHSHLTRAHRAGNLMARLLGLPHVGTLHVAYRAKEHAACDALIAIAAWQLADIPPPVRARTQVIWNWLALPAKPTQKKQARGAGFVFGSAGRLHPQKNMPGLVRAFRLAFPNTPGNMPDVRLEIAGEGPEHAAVLAAKGDDARVVLLGQVKEMAACYARWDAYVSAAQSEPFGLTVLEAMAWGLPLVCTRTQGPSEFLAPQPVAPHWAAVGDDAALAEALKNCHTAGHRRVAWAMAPFAPERALERVTAVYAHVRQ